MLFESFNMSNITDFFGEKQCCDVFLLKHWKGYLCNFLATKIPQSLTLSLPFSLFQRKLWVSFQFDRNFKQPASKIGIYHFGSLENCFMCFYTCFRQHPIRWFDNGSIYIHFFILSWANLFKLLLELPFPYFYLHFTGKKISFIFNHLQGFIKFYNHYLIFWLGRHQNPQILSEHITAVLSLSVLKMGNRFPLVITPLTDCHFQDIFPVFYRFCDMIKQN